MVPQASTTSSSHPPASFTGTTAELLSSPRNTFRPTFPCKTVNMASQQTQVGPETPIVVKVTVNDASVRKLKIPLKDLGASVLPGKVSLPPHTPLFGLH